MFQPSEKAKQRKKAGQNPNHSKNATMDSNDTKDFSLEHNFQRSWLVDTIRESLPFGYTISAPFNDTISKDGIVNSSLPILVCDTAVEKRCARVSSYLQVCMVDKMHQACVFLNIDDVKYLRFATWLRRT